MSGYPSYRRFRTKNSPLDLRLLWNRSLAVLFCLCLVLLFRALLGLGTGGSHEPKNTLFGNPLLGVYGLRHAGSSLRSWDESSEENGSSMVGGRGVAGQAHAAAVDTASETNDIHRAPSLSQEHQVTERLM